MLNISEALQQALMMRLFLDFITADALKNNILQPYTIAQSEAAHSLIHGIELDYDDRGGA